MLTGRLKRPVNVLGEVIVASLLWQWIVVGWFVFVVIIIGNHGTDHSGSAFDGVFANGINCFYRCGDQGGDAAL